MSTYNLYRDIVQPVEEARRTTWTSETNPMRAEVITLYRTKEARESNAYGRVVARINPELRGPDGRLLYDLTLWMEAQGDEPASSPPKPAKQRIGVTVGSAIHWTLLYLRDLDREDALRSVVIPEGVDPAAAWAALDQAGHVAAPDAVSPEEAAVSGANDQGDEAWVSATIAHLRSVGLLPAEEPAR